MKAAGWIFTICCTCYLNSAWAFSNQFSAGIEHSELETESTPVGGATTDGDFTADEYVLSYVRFLAPVEDDGGPLDLLPYFNSRSSYVFGDFYSGNYDFEISDFDYDSEKDWRGFAFGGLFFVTDSTALGVGYFKESGDWEDNDSFPDEYDEDRDGLNLRLLHYLDDNNRLAFGISQSERERDFDNGLERTDEYDWITFSYDGLLGAGRSIYLDVDYGIGSRKREQNNGFEQDHDLTWYGITVGPVYRQFAVYLSYDYYEWDPDGDAWEAEQTYWTISPRYWFNEQYMLGGSYYTVSWDESQSGSYDYEETGYGIEIFGRFRF